MDTLKSRNTVYAFTYQPVEMILGAGGSGQWVVNSDSLAGIEYIVCVHNSVRAAVEEGATSMPHKHRHAFLVGRFSGWSPGPEYPNRKVLEFSEYALVDKPNASEGRGPIRYGNLADIGIDPDKLDWQPMPPRQPKQAAEPKPTALKPTGPARSEMDALAQRFRTELGGLLGIPGTAERISILVDATGTGNLVFHL